MSNENQPDLGEDYIRLHKVMTRGIEVSKHSIDKYLNEGAMDELNREGFTNYIQSFSAVLHGHHMVEDQKIFPYFKDQLPEVPYPRLTSEHEIFNQGLQEINTATKELTAKNNELESLNLLKSGLNKVDKLWDAHIQIENTQLYGKIRSLDMDPEEMSKIGNESKEFFQAHSGPTYLVIPFVLYNLSLDDRKIISQSFPDEVINQLLFGDWKDKWISMKPYLLK
ncbi:MAG: hemerythrin domain-containing protein [Methanobacterium sp. ERen5]|nr:MAG: hemerythrin domain-containing protein [Methanobacterium sp. ERen5]